ncbi:MAG: hypothetical protein UU65_C0007G0006 [candidate division CPR2 bacterium GW2011_GWC1_41_48]|uniref:Uncharacterized protein n=1 Tax=candidate division CPR2 bacterium GW2011_GWC1_41_48 TaxID=1618344 RepID=A0A0G0W6N2_UNCC2|nr:MAG: hypothetical protein UT47_C0008G0016 [candidate division CPR2 bacterium GW2011_GWC2_39_35]KKR27521.1 MAG: hypothetical protein UT60_C0046G0005 [candidate division CPR2 bacterium GW2011_GWD2_39_7]KKS08610.1 MAG: hypothetical protein UU65_C0007G0006 [candidate division CPR2 bacterium GW2011_GWC1_41_48]OGB71496.1 MAG: hypothetical protein A2Y26_05135 [candidate division CPR2 bacterium GWD2_39_7]
MDIKDSIENIFMAISNNDYLVEEKRRETRGYKCDRLKMHGKLVDCFKKMGAQEFYPFLRARRENRANRILTRFLAEALNQWFILHEVERADVPDEYLEDYIWLLRGMARVEVQA